MSNKGSSATWNNGRRSPSVSNVSNQESERMINADSNKSSFKALSRNPSHSSLGSNTPTISTYVRETPVPVIPPKNKTLAFNFLNSTIVKPNALNSTVSVNKVTITPIPTSDKHKIIKLFNINLKKMGELNENKKQGGFFSIFGSSKKINPNATKDKRIDVILFLFGIFSINIDNIHRNAMKITDLDKYFIDNGKKIDKFDIKQGKIKS